MDQTELMKFCAKVLGSPALAEEWIASPAMALDNQLPADLMSTEQGRRKVEVLLTQLEYGVYV